MATEYRRMTVLLHDRDVLATLGLDPDKTGTTPVWAALSRYAEHVRRAGRELEPLLSREDWMFLADALNGSADLWEYTGSPQVDALTLVIATVEDARPDLGDKWYGTGRGDEVSLTFVGVLRALTPIHGDAILAAVRHFWSLDDPADAGEWWRVSHRLKSSQTP